MVVQEASKTFKDERLPEMTQQLDINIARLNDQLMQIKNTLEEGASPIHPLTRPLRDPIDQH